MARPAYSATILIPAAGTSTRFGRPKQLEPLCGVPVLQRTVEIAAQVPGVREIVVATSADLIEVTRGLVEGIPNLPVQLVEGGVTRTDSVRRAFDAAGVTDLVVVHDAARPLASVELYQRVMAAALQHGAAVPALPIADTLKRAEGEEPQVTATLDRTGLWAVQTPQAFARDVLAEAFAADSDEPATDEAMLVERLGGRVRIVEGDPANGKITRPADLKLAEVHFRARAGLGAVRVGLGRDRHPLEKGRPLVLAGIEIEGAPVGPVGHSDGDALCHAIADAILGAAGAGDLGGLFPDDAQWTEGISGDEILLGAVDAAAVRGLVVSSVDATLWIARPKLAAHLPAVRTAIAAALGIDEDRVNLKAKSGNDIDAVGKGEATEGEAIVVLTWR